MISLSLILQFLSLAVFVSAVTQYSNIVKPEFNLIEYDTKREVDYAINKLKLLGGSTMTSPALDYIRRKGFSTENGGRQYAPKVQLLNILLYISIDYIFQL